MKKLIYAVATLAVAVFIISGCSKEGATDAPTVETVHKKDTVYSKSSSGATNAIPIPDASDPAGSEYSSWKSAFWDMTVIPWYDFMFGSRLFYTSYVPFIYICECDLTTNTINDYESGYVKSKKEYRNIKAARKLADDIMKRYEESEAYDYYSSYGTHQYSIPYGVDLTDPSIAQEKVYTHSDIVGDWVNVSEIQPSGGDDDGSGDDTPAGDHTGDSRYLKYVGSTTGYYESGNSYKKETVYIFKVQSGSTLRTSTQKGNSYGFILKSATYEVHRGSDPWGLKCNKYYSSIGIKTYFKW